MCSSIAGAGKCSENRKWIFICKLHCIMPLYLIALFHLLHESIDWALRPNRHPRQPCMEKPALNLTFCNDAEIKGKCKNSVCSRNSPQPCLDPHKSEWHDGQRQINEAGKCIRENTAWRTKFRGGARVEACQAAVWIEFAFGRLGVMTTRASWLA